MKIIIKVYDEKSERFMEANANTFERAYEELAALERFVERENDKADVMAESLKEEGV